MTFKLSEYNVLPKVEQRDPFSIELTNGELLYNEQKVTDNTKVDLIINMFNQYKDEIARLNSTPASNYKGGRQQAIRIQYEDGKTFTVTGNTPEEEMANLYLELKNKMISIIEQ